jgi:FKBP-type peptidyl-prolyl cis-trans isomerase
MKKTMSNKMINDEVICDKMMSRFLLLIFLSIITLSLFSCREPAPQVPANKLSETSISEEMMLMNKEFAELEIEEINLYIDSLNLDMSQTVTGLRYKIIKEGEGEPLQKGDRVTFNYSIRTLDNMECEELKNVTKTIELGTGAIEKGVEEAIMLLRVSGKGWFIIPSYLAYGVPGYKNCISSWTPVFCEINIIDVGY